MATKKWSEVKRNKGWITKEEYETFVETWLKLKPVVEALTGPSTAKIINNYGREEYSYISWPDGYHDFSSQGIWINKIEEDRYDGYRSNTEYLIPLEHILDPAPLIEAHENKLIEIEKQRLEDSKNWERQTYERLKEKFEGNNK